jgi:membrane-bound acyltransferase YfiQ involved in biofilm formation
MNPNRAIKAFLAKYTITAHSIAVAFGVVVLVYNQVPAVHDGLTHLYNVFPATLREMIFALLTFCIWYKTNLSAKGTKQLNTKFQEKQYGEKPKDGGI